MDTDGKVRGKCDSGDFFCKGLEEQPEQYQTDITTRRKRRILPEKQVRKCEKWAHDRGAWKGEQELGEQILPIQGKRCILILKGSATVTQGPV